MQNQSLKGKMHEIIKIPDFCGNTKKYKGHATIELTNVKTGEVERYEEDNLVTDAINELLGKNFFGLGLLNSDCFDNDYKYGQIPAHNLMSGVLLFENQIEEDPKNIFWTKNNQPAAWAGNKQNASTCTKRGSINLEETGPTDTGYQFVWEWTTAQGNGSYSCVALTNGETGNMDDSFGNRWTGANVSYPIAQMMRKQENGKNIPGYSNSADADDIFLKLTRCVYIDRKNDVWYHLTINSATEITLRAYKRCINNLPLGQSNYIKKTLSTSVNDYYAKEISTQTFTLSDKINYNSNAKVNSVSCRENEIFIFTAQNNTNTVLITKIDVSNPKSISVTQETKTYSDVKFGVEGTSNIDFIHNLFPFLNGYLYLPDYYDNYNYVKVSISDESDISNVEQDGTLTNSLKTLQAAFNDYDQGLYYSIYAGTAAKRFLLNDKLTEMKSIIYNYAQNKTTVNQISRLMSVVGYEKEQYLLMNTYYLATINNISQITKTADKTMKITYKITEQVPEGSES